MSKNKDEINPSNPVVAAARDNWHKIAAMIMWKTGLKEVVITDEDIDEMNKGGFVGIAISEKGKNLCVHFVQGEGVHRLVSGAMLDERSRKST